MNTKAAEAVREAAERITLAQVQEACTKNGFAKPFDGPGQRVRLDKLRGPMMRATTTNGRLRHTETIT
jgi:hypothetical protein